MQLLIITYCCLISNSLRDTTTFLYMFTVYSALQLAIYIFHVCRCVNVFPQVEVLSDIELIYIFEFS